jgi:transketolase
MNELLSIREAFGNALLEIGEFYPNLVVLDADISASLKTKKFSTEYPNRHFNFGTAEQNMLLAAAGLSTVELIPVACTFATFCTMRSCEQIRSFICYANLNVKIVGSHGGIENSWDGPTHQATEDIAIMRSLPNMTIIVPADANAAANLTRQMVEINGPVYFRMMRNASPIIYSKEQRFEFGKANLLRTGEDLTIIATGRLVPIALEAADELSNTQVSTRVIDMYTIKPLDREIILEAAHQTNFLITAEDHNVMGGLGTAVAECLAEDGVGKLFRVGIKDTFARSGKPELLYEKYGLSCNQLVKIAYSALDIKSKQ